MINKDRIVSVTKTDLLSLYYFILEHYLDGNLALCNASGVGTFDIDFSTYGNNALFLTEPAEKINITGDSVPDDSGLYFVPATDFEGIFVNGEAAKINIPENIDFVKDGASCYHVVYRTVNDDWEIVMA